MTTGGPTIRHPMGNNTRTSMNFLLHTGLFHAEKTTVSCGATFQKEGQFFPLSATIPPGFVVPL